MIWVCQLYDTIKVKSNHTGINYDHNNINKKSYNDILYCVKFNFCYQIQLHLSRKGTKRLVFQLSFVNLQRAKDVTHMFDAKYRYAFIV